MLTTCGDRDYAVSYHVAEFFNVSPETAPDNTSLGGIDANYRTSHQAFTNIIFFILGIRGLMMCSQGSHDTIYILGYLGYTIVGLGSTAFHATLKCTTRLVPLAESVRECPG